MWPIMRVLVTADLHYDVPRSRSGARDLAANVCRQGGDALVLVGDTAGAAPEALFECLSLFSGFSGRRLLVPGNHCLWCREGEDSLDRYRDVLPDVCEEAGFSVLDHEPVVLGDVGLVGSVGWYDYSFRDASLGIPEAFYAAKVSPGAARRLEEHRRLFERHGRDLTKRQRGFAARWMDGLRVRLPMDDAAFVEYLAGRLETQLRALSEKVERIVAFVHHLPFRQLVPTDRPDRFAFAAAFLGAGRIGEVLSGCPKVTHVYCGHSHWSAQCTIGHLKAVSIGSTYVDKCLEVLELNAETKHVDIAQR
jgi:Calcineurin-like phosphoesterase